MSSILNQTQAYRNAGYTYGWGGTGNNKKIDCSHLVSNVLRGAGYNIPYQNTEALENSKYLDVVDPTEVQPGDIALWRGELNHTGIVETVDAKGETGTFFGSQRNTRDRKSHV